MNPTFTDNDSGLTKKERRELREKEKLSYKESKQRRKRNIRILKKIITFGAVILVGIFIWNLATAPLDPARDPKNILQIREDDWVKGHRDAPVQLIEYLDFECESCRAYHPLVKQLKQEMWGDIVLITRYFPLPGHKNSMNAALAVEAAGKQWKYWEMGDLLFESQSQWSHGQSDPVLFVRYAQQLGLDMQKFEKDRNDSATRARVEKNKNEGPSIGVSGTPTFFLNGEKIQNPKSIEDFKILIQAAKLKAPLQQGKVGQKVHEHADIALYLDGKKVDLSQEKYQSTETKSLHPDTHLHDGNGEILHKHRTLITLGDFFNSVGIQFTDNCFTLDTKEQYCNSGTKTLKFIVNGLANDQFDKYELKDEDKILISYGDQTQEALQTQINSVSDDACLYSETCPERGKAPTEHCVGGLGTDC